MSCDHDLDICVLPPSDDLSPGELLDRLVHIGWISGPIPTPPVPPEGEG